MAEGITPTLLRLPPELRNRIWELVVFHEPTGGVICPLQDTHGQANASPYASSMAMVSGARFLIQRKIPNFDYPKKYIRSVQIAGGKAEYFTIMDLWKLWQGSPQVNSEHCCNLDCLLQPPIARVNMQIRAESLPLFYSTNHFHFEMSNFALASKYYTRMSGEENPRDQRTPVDWFESIGNPNLSNITRLDIVGQSWHDCEHNGIMVKYDRDREMAETVVTLGLLNEKSPLTWHPRPPWVNAEKQRELHMHNIEKLQQVLEVVRRDGLSAALMRRIVYLLEPSDVRYLRT